MADEWWNSARTGGDASTCLTAPATESEASGTSMNFQPGLSDAAAPSSSFLADPHMDWTQAFMGEKAAAAESTTSSNALLQLQGDASHFLLDGEAHLLPAQYADGTAVAASYQYSGSASSYAFSQLLKSSAASAQHQHQQFPGFFSSSGLFSPAPEPPQLPLQTLEPKPVKDLKVQSNTEPVQDACSSVTRTSVSDSPAAVKKPRIAMPSPLPTFKVRKEKLGDRITALQQLVSPFGKTDTASVLHEAIEYIKFLHDQVASLSSPYLRCGRPVQLQHQQGSDKAKDGGEAKQDLRSRGLCLVPVASTYSVASEAAPEFWHPTFGGTFR